jgi:uncharacterized protein
MKYFARRGCSLGRRERDIDRRQWPDRCPKARRAPGNRELTEEPHALGGAKTGYCSVMSRANVEIVRRVADAWERRDMETVFALYDPAIVWDNSTLPAPSSGSYHGHEQVRQFFQEWLEAFETQDIRAETFIDAGDRVVVGHRISGRGKTSGAEVEMHRWMVYSVRNGLVARIDVFETNVQALEAAGLSERAQADS